MLSTRSSGACLTPRDSRRSAAPFTARRPPVAASGHISAPTALLPTPSPSPSPVPASAPPPSHPTPSAPAPPAGRPATATRRSLLLLAPAAAAAALASLSPAAAAAKPSAAAEPGDWSSPGLGAPVDPSQPQFVRLPSGVRYQQLNVGSGPAAGPGDTVLFDYVLRRSNGYFIYGTVEGVSFQPRDVPTVPVNLKLGSGELIPGLEEVLLGMSPGTKRRALVPPELGYVGGSEQPQPPTFATKRQLETHRREPLLFEVQMLRVGGRKQ